MLVSTSAATVVELLSGPTTVGLCGEFLPLETCFHPLRRFIKKPQPLLRRQSGTSAIRGRNTDGIAGGDQFDFIAHADTESIDEALGQRNLKFSGHAGHWEMMRAVLDPVKD